MAEPRRPSGGEIRALTGLRLVAALWVVAHHVRLFAPDAGWLDGIAPLRPLLAGGWLGVDLFFVLSGFVLAHNYVAVLGPRPGLRATTGFLRARLSRIWPTWFVVLALVTAGQAVERGLLGGATASSLDPVTLLRSLLLVQVWDRPDYSATGPVGPGWSLSAEWLAYLLFPALALVLHRLRHRSAAVLAALALSAVLPFAVLCWTTGTHDWAWSWALRLAGAFVAGALVALCVARVPARDVVPRLAARVAGAAAVLVPAVLWAVGEGRGGAVVVLFPVLVGALALTDGGVARPLSTPWVVLGGRVSFALYLVHMGVLEAGWTILGAVPGLPGTAVGTVAHAAVLVAPLPAAWVLWRWVEEPARRRLRPRPAPVAAPSGIPSPRTAGDAPVLVST